MTGIPQAEVQAISGASARDIENWLARFPLATKFQKTARGRARLFSFENTLELTLIARLVRAGFSIGAAAKRVNFLFKECFEQERRRPPWALLIFDDESEMPPALAFDCAPTPELYESLQDVGEVYVILDIASIERHVARQFGVADAQVA